MQIQKLESFDFVLKLILNLTHGQAAVDRSFSTNKNILAQNIKPETIFTRKIIKDICFPTNSNVKVLN